MKAFVLVRKISVCHGHGDYGEEIAMATTGYEARRHPAFSEYPLAEIYLKRMQDAHMLSSDTEIDAIDVLTSTASVDQAVKSETKKEMDKQ